MSDKKEIEIKFRVPESTDKGYIKRMKSVLSFQIEYTKIQEETERLAKLKNGLINNPEAGTPDTASLELQMAEKMLSFFDKMVDFLSMYCEGDNKDEIKEGLAELSQDELTNLLSLLGDAGAPQRLPPTNTEQSNG